MKVFVAGHRGMLGHVAARYFSQNECEVETSEQRYLALPHDALVEEIRASSCTWVVNALGKIKQKCQDAKTLFAANSLFPLHLKKRLRPDQRLIHASTDCVFSGHIGNYSIDAVPDPEDEYGLSKLLGECVAESGRAYVLRTSIIGPEQEGHAGLMSWFLRQEGTVNGFTNHLWNGITTLEWSKVCLEIMHGQHAAQEPLCHVGIWPPVSKHRLLAMIGKVWNHSIILREYAAPDALDRSLRPTLLRSSHYDQLVALKHWYAPAVLESPRLKRLL